MIATERKLDPSETKAIMTGRLSTYQIGQFCEKHQLSHEWLLGGSLQGLKRMAESNGHELLSVATTREMQLAQWQEYTRLYGRLGNDAVPIALAFLRNLSNKGGAA